LENPTPQNINFNLNYKFDASAKENKVDKNF
jgi:hypothetical protein